MKKLFCLLFLLPLFAVAQKIITHTVGQKESLSSIGRLYNVNGRELANYNKIDYDKGLSLGQVLKIPAKNVNTDVPIPPPPAKTVAEVKPVAVTVEKGGTIYHTVEKKQTLYAVSKLYNITIADIKKWNSLTSDALSEGLKLIVGYTNEKAAVETKTPPIVTKTTVEKPAKDVTEVIKPKKEESPPIKTPNEDEIKVQTKTEKKEVVLPAKKIEAAATPANNVTAADFKAGAFKNIFDEQTNGKQLVNETGAGGIFKSTSGWEDGKYYCLHNTAAAGTILKITNNTTGKWVYAKVLDLIPDIKQNGGLIVRISNAAANALGAAQDKLNCTINYSK